MPPKATSTTQLRVPVWIAVLLIALFLAVWTVVLAQLIGDHVAAARAAAAVAGHGTAV